MAQNAIPPEHLNVLLNWKIVEYLNQQAASKPEQLRESIEVATQCLEESFGLHALSAEHRAQLSQAVPQALPAVFSAGLSSNPPSTTPAPAPALSSPAQPTHTPSPPARVSVTSEPRPVAPMNAQEELLAEYPDLKNNEKFSKYLARINATSYFEGIDPGSPEYRARFQKAVNKFLKTNPPASTATTPHPLTLEEARAKAEALCQRARESNTPAAGDTLFGEALAIPSLDSSTRHSILRERGFLRHARGNFRLAIEDLTECTGLKADDLKATVKLGGALKEEKQYVKAVDVFEKALDMDPTNRIVIGKRDECIKLAKSESQPRTSDTGGMRDGGLGGGGMGGGGMGGGAGFDMGSLAGMLNNPELMGMAQQAMANPAMMQSAMSMLQQMGMGMGGEGPPLAGAPAPDSGNIDTPPTPAAMPYSTVVGDRDVGGPVPTDGARDQPGFDQFMGSPEMQEMLGSGGLQDMMQSVMSDPQMMSNIMGMMGGMGRGEQGGMGGPDHEALD